MRSQVWASPFRAKGNQGRSKRVDLQKVPGVRGAVVAKNVDLELLGPVEVAKLRGEGEAAFGEVDAPIFPAVTFSATLDAGAHILVLTAEIGRAHV